MDIQKIQYYKTAFDLIVKEIKDEEGDSIEVWYARELQPQLGYARWENFVVAIGRAMESCKTLGINIDDHFREVTKMIALAKGAQRDIQDFMLTRYACYLIAQNGDPKKEEVAFAQSYFAVQTRLNLPPKFIRRKLGLSWQETQTFLGGNPEFGETSAFPRTNLSNFDEP